jgi:hypothetical protein
MGATWMLFEEELILPGVSGGIGDMALLNIGQKFRNTVWKYLSLCLSYRDRQRNFTRAYFDYEAKGRA